MFWRLWWGQLTCTLFLICFECILVLGIWVWCPIRCIFASFGALSLGLIGWAYGDGVEFSMEPMLCFVRVGGFRLSLSFGVWWLVSCFFVLGVWVLCICLVNLFDVWAVIQLLGVCSFTILNCTGGLRWQIIMKCSIGLWLCGLVVL